MGPPVEKPGSLKDQISQALAQGSVVLDFSGVRDLTSTCLNTFLGPVYGELAHNTIRQRLTITGAGADITALIEHSVPAWLRYFESRRSSRTGATSSRSALQ